MGNTIREPFGKDAGNQLNVGTPETGYAVKEYGDSTFHKTVITLDGNTLPAIAGGADLAVGRKVYTFPHKNVRILTAAFNNVAIKQTEGNIDADTPDVGIGTTIASGAVATLDGTAAFENILTGQTFTDCDGTAEIAVVGSTQTLAKTTNAYAVHFNVADGWAADGDEGALISGDIVITWEVIE